MKLRSSLALALLLVSGAAQAADPPQRVRLYDSAGRPAGHKMVRDGGRRVDLYDSKLRPAGRIERDGKDARFYDKAGRPSGKASAR